MKITILALENQNQTSAVADVLQTAGHAYVICESVKAVLDSLRTAPPDLLVVFARTSTSTSFPEWVGHIKRVLEVNGRSTKEFDPGSLKAYLEEKWSQKASIILVYSREGKTDLVTIKE